MKGLNSSSKVVFAFSDTAGANCCLAFAFLLSKEYSIQPKLFTNNPEFKKNSWDLHVDLVEKFTVENLNDADLLFTGTSHPDTSKSFELHAIQIAGTNTVRSIAYIDHWTSFKLRFLLDKHSVFPDEIWVRDEAAHKAATEDGIPKEKLVVYQNPYLIYLSDYWRSKFPNGIYRNQIGIPPDNKIILIAPDPVSIRKETVQFGFTEFTALKDFLEMIGKLEIEKVSIVIKTHPLQPLKIIEAIKEEFAKLNISIITAGDSLELIYISDVVMGFYSNFLLEARALHKPVVRYFPGSIEHDPLKHIVTLTPVSNMHKALLTLHDLLK